jgi:hypothetical protein
MNKSELDSILKKARTPERSEEFWEMFPGQIAIRLNRARTDNHPPKRNWFPRLAWGFATVICVLAAFAIGHWRGQRETKASTDVLANAKVVRETLAMFPNQVRAIMEDEHGLNLVLSDSDNVPASPPLYVRICDGKHCSSLVTFSGQEIQVAGQKMTVLSDTQGGIILMGNNFAWSSREPAYAKNDLKIQAMSLGSIAM